MGVEVVVEVRGVYCQSEAPRLESKGRGIRALRRDRGPDVDFSAWTGQRPARQSLGSQRRPERRGVTASMSLMRVATARRRPAASERAVVLRELLKERLARRWRWRSVSRDATLAAG